MARLTSFSDETFNPPEGKEWIVVGDGYKPINGQPRYIATSGKQIVKIGFCNLSNGLNLNEGGRTITVSMAGTVLQVVHITLPLKESTLEFEYSPSINESYRFNSEMVKLRQIATGFEIEIVGVGKAWTRKVWRDLDVTKNIREFIHTDCEDPINEEALVWLAGVLSLHLISRYGM